MTSLTFGLTMLVVGMGGTMLTLWLLTILLRRLTAVFPVKESDEARKDAGDPAP